MSTSNNNQCGKTDVKIKKILSYDWTINNYTYVDHEAVTLRSPTFTVGSETVKFYLVCHPRDDKDCTKICICREDSDYQIRCCSYLSVLDKNKKKVWDSLIDLLNWNYEDWSASLFLDRKDLIFNLLDNNCLTIRCDFVEMTMESIDCSSESEKRSRNLILPEIKSEPSEFEKMFLNDRLSDVKLIASCGKSLPAHRCILAAFSPVFDAMFFNDMREKNEGEVKIDDGKYEALKEMLRFIYTGKVENVASNVIDVIVLADKYQISRLKDAYEGELIRTIVIDNVINYLEIAYQYNLENLKMNALDFTKSYQNEVINSDAYKSLTNIQVLKSITEGICQMNNYD